MNDAEARVETRAEDKAQAEPVQAAKQPMEKKMQMTKSDFVRKQPASMTAAEVVKRGARDGIKLTVGLVHTVRSNDKARKAKYKAKKNGHANGNAPKNGYTNGALIAVKRTKQEEFTKAIEKGVSQYEELIELVKIIGFDRARNLLLTAARQHLTEVNSWIAKVEGAA